jgi:Mg2+/citrate symporter
MDKEKQNSKTSQTYNSHDSVSLGASAQSADRFWSFVLPLCFLGLVLLIFYFRIVGYLVGAAVMMYVFAQNNSRLQNYKRLLGYGLCGAVIVPAIAFTVGLILQQSLSGAGFFEWIGDQALLPTPLDRVVLLVQGVKVENAEWLVQQVKISPTISSLAVPTFMAAISGALWNSMLLPPLLYFCPRHDITDRNDAGLKMTILLGIFLLFPILTLLCWFNEGLFDSTIVQDSYSRRRSIPFSEYFLISGYWFLSAGAFVAIQSFVRPIKDYLGKK